MFAILTLPNLTAGILTIGDGNLPKEQTAEPPGFFWIELPLSIHVNWTVDILMIQIGFAPKNYF